MRIGINLWVWGAPITDEQIADRVPHAAEMGFDVVEVPLEEPDGFDYGHTARVLADHDVDAGIIAAMSEDRDMLHDDPDVRQNGREYVRECIDAATAIGADRVVGPLYSAVGRTWTLSDEDRAQAIDRVVAQLEELAAYAAERDVILCVEPLNRFETSVFNTVEQTIDVIDRVDSPSCTLLLDTFHMSIEEKSLADAIRLAGDRIGHVHACGNDRGAPGNGHLDWDAIVAALDDAAYDDQLVIESFTPEVESIARAASIWRTLEDSQDQLASDGLAFLAEYYR